MNPPPKDWNDRALDELAKRVDNLSGEFDIVRELPWDLAQALERDRDRTDEAFREADRTEVRRVSELRSYVDRRLEERPVPRASWSEIVKTVVVPVVVPVIVALIGGYFVMRAAMEGVG